MKRKVLLILALCGLIIMLEALIYAVFKSPEQIETIARAFLLFFEAVEKVVLI